MKKLLFVLALLAMVSTFSIAQGFKLGGGLTLGTAMGLDDDGSDKLGFGLNVRGDYAFNDAFSIAPGFTFFFPSSPDGIDLTAWQLNADAHYAFMKDEAFRLYAIGGLNYSYMKVEVNNEMFGSVSADDGEVGLNLGAGINFGKMFFGELKYDTAYEQLGITVGLLFGVN